VILDFKKSFDSIPYYKSSYNKKVLVENNLKNPFLVSANPQSNIWSQLLYAARTYFEKLTTEI